MGRYDVLVSEAKAAVYECDQVECEETMTMNSKYTDWMQYEVRTIGGEVFEELHFCLTHTWGRSLILRQGEGNE